MLVNLFKSKDEIAEVKLISYVDFVKSILLDSQCSVPFYIMGGSVYGTLKGLNEFNDIDVFFSNLEDAEAAIAAVEAKIAAIDKYNTDDLFTLSMGLFSTPNAISFNWVQPGTELPIIVTNKKIQFIRKKWGTVQEIFNTFDLNASQCCITSNYDIVTNVTLDEDIKINFKEFKSNTFQRYHKYVTEKKCTDEGATQVFESIDYLIDNFFIKIEDSMYDNIETKGCQIISSIIHNYTESSKVRKYLYDEMRKKIKKEELIQAFIDLDFDFGVIADFCTEYDVYILTVKKSSLVTPYAINQAHEQYPEYFI